MADHTTPDSDSSADSRFTDRSGDRSGPQEGRFRGGRGPGGRDGGGGFRIRLSDNEMRAARAVQEAFGLRSTVAALGFSIRTIGQMLEDGQLDELAAQMRSQGGARRGRGEGRRGEGRFRGEERGGPRPDPFARPQKPPAISEEPPSDPAEPAEPGPEAGPAADPSPETDPSS